MFKTQEAAAYYIAGIIDGEGTVQRRNGKQVRYVSITNTDLDIVSACERALSKLGVTYSKRCFDPRCSGREHWKLQWTISIHSHKNFKLLACVPLQCSYKREKLKDILESYKRVSIETIDQAQMIKWYTEDRLSFEDIGSKLGVKAMTARAWLHNLGVTSRSHSENTARLWSQRRESNSISVKSTSPQVPRRP